MSDKYNTSRRDPKLFVYGYVFHRKSSEIQACCQNGFKCKDLRHASTRDLPPAVRHAASRHGTITAKWLFCVSWLAFIFPTRGLCRSEESSVRSEMCIVTVYLSAVIQSWMQVARKARKARGWMGKFTLFSGMRLVQLMNCFQCREISSKIMNWMTHLLRGAGKHTLCLINKEFYSGDTAALRRGAGALQKPVRDRRLG